MFDPAHEKVLEGSRATPTSLDVDLAGGVGSFTQVDLALNPPVNQVFRAGQTIQGEDTRSPRQSGGGDGTFAIYSSACEGVDWHVLDVASTGKTITRLDLTFAVTCGTSTPKMVGELTMGEQSSAPLAVSSRNFDWSTAAVGVTSPALLPVRYRNVTGSVQQTSRVSIRGDAAHDFAVRSDRCSGRRVAPHATCTMSVAFTPGRSGRRTASLELSAGGHLIRVGLSGTGAVGRSSFTLLSPSTRWLGPVRAYLVTAAEFPIQVVRMHQRNALRLAVQGLANQGMDLTVYGPAGRAFTAGDYSTDDSGSPDYELQADANAASCGSYEPGKVVIRQISFDAYDDVSQLDLSFRQQCADEPDGLLVGRVEYDATTPAGSVPPTPFILRAGHALGSGHQLENYVPFVSSDSPIPPQTTLGLTDAGRLELRYDHRVAWSVGPAGPKARLVLDKTGRLALLDRMGKAVWAVHPLGSSGSSFLEAQTNGDLTLYSGEGRPLWRAHTAAQN